MKRVEEGSLEFLPQIDATGLQAGGRQDIDDNKDARVEVEGAPRAMEVVETEGGADDEYGEDGIDGGDVGSPSLSMKVVLATMTISIEARMDMEAVGENVEEKTEMEGAHFSPPVPVEVAPSDTSFQCL